MRRIVQLISQRNIDAGMRAEAYFAIAMQAYASSFSIMFGMEAATAMSGS